MVWVQVNKADQTGGPLSKQRTPLFFSILLFIKAIGIFTFMGIYKIVRTPLPEAQLLSV